jgi:hypothetical protein
MATNSITVAQLPIFLSKQCAKKTMYIEFVKKGDGTLRKMTFQLSGSKADNGDRLPIHRVHEDAHHDTLTVWDLNKDGYRRLNLVDVKRLVIDQDEWIVVP